MMPGESILSGLIPRCIDCTNITGTRSACVDLEAPLLTFQILESPAGLYIGTFCHVCNEVHSRESEYYDPVARHRCARDLRTSYEPAWFKAVALTQFVLYSKGNYAGRAEDFKDDYELISRGCPNVRSTIYRPDQLEVQVFESSADLTKAIDDLNSLPTPTPYRVRCYSTHGIQYVTRDEYNRQMRDPNSRWRCPKCNCLAGFDDEWYEACQVMSPEEAFQAEKDGTLENKAKEAWEEMERKLDAECKSDEDIPF